MDQKDHIIDQKGLQMYEKRQKMGFSDLKYLLFNGIFLSGIGGYPPPPLNGKSSCPKTLSGKGGYDSLSDVPESRVCFASKNLTPCRMH